MQTIVSDRYGSPDVLRVEERPIPPIRDDDVLVRVHAASVNSWDWELLQGTPLVNRLGAWRRPRHPVLGADIAGRIEAVGANVDVFRPGDGVFGDLSGCGWGGFAEYAAAPAAALVPKPAGLTFEEAAAIPQAATLAFQGLRRGGPIQAGHRVLINGAGGGMGTFAVQMAASLGAEVTGVDAADKLDLVSDLGAAHVVDYRQEDFTRTGRRYDLILDAVAHRSLSDYRRALEPEGALVVVGGAFSRILRVMILGHLLSMRSKQRLGVLVHKPNRDDLVAITELIEASEVNPVIDSRFPLTKVPDALAHFGNGRVTGKVVITVAG